MSLIVRRLKLYNSKTEDGPDLHLAAATRKLAANGCQFNNITNNYFTWAILNPNDALVGLQVDFWPLVDNAKYLKLNKTRKNKTMRWVQYSLQMVHA